MNPTMKTSCNCCLLLSIPGVNPVALVVLAGTESCWCTWRNVESSRPLCQHICLYFGKTAQLTTGQVVTQVIGIHWNQWHRWLLAHCCREGLDRDQSFSFLPYSRHACCRVVVGLVLANRIFPCFWNKKDEEGLQPSQLQIPALRMILDVTVACTTPWESI